MAGCRGAVGGNGGPVGGAVVGWQRWCSGWGGGGCGRVRWRSGGAVLGRGGGGGAVGLCWGGAVVVGAVEGRWGCAGAVVVGAVVSVRERD